LVEDSDAINRDYDGVCRPLPQCEQFAVLRISEEGADCRAVGE
jgi:hypothetical protein